MSAPTLFADRQAAGRALALALHAYRGRGDVIVLGLPRGGVAVARVVADALQAPLDVVVARKLGVPGLEEVALGAIAEGWTGMIEDAVRWYLGVPRRVVLRIVESERREVEWRVRMFREGQPLPELRGRTVILVDDGLATGATLRAAAKVVRSKRAGRIIAAVPVASPDHCAEVRASVDELVTLATPAPFQMVSTWFDRFEAVTDATVLTLLGRGAVGALVKSPEAWRTGSGESELSIPIDATGPDRVIIADFGLPNDSNRPGRGDSPPPPRGLVILAHGGGSSRGSYRNRYLAGRLRFAGWAALRVDLLTESERAADATGAFRFDIAHIARRLQRATEWAARQGLPGAHRLVLFGASTGAAAALVTAATRPDLVHAVAARGGRVDLAADVLDRVRAPVLMMVGGSDAPTLAANRAAARRLRGPSAVAVIRGAGHTFDEPGALGSVGERVTRWLDRLSPRSPGWLCALTRA